MKPKSYVLPGGDDVRNCSLHIVAPDPVRHTPYIIDFLDILIGKRGGADSKPGITHRLNWMLCHPEHKG